MRPKLDAKTAEPAFKKSVGAMSPPRTPSTHCVAAAGRGRSVKTGFACTFAGRRSSHMDVFNVFWPHLPNVPSQVFAKLQVSTGARLGEMGALRRSDIDFEAKTVNIARVVIRIDRKRNKTESRLVERPRTKTGQGWRIDLPDSVLKM